ncbi:unnamed protein product [Cochlearia groenlandica]
MEITPPMPTIRKTQTTLTPPAQNPVLTPPGSTGEGQSSQVGSSTSNATSPLNLEALLNAPSRKSQPILHPKKKDGTLWFGIDPQVNKIIRNTWQSNYMGAWWNYQFQTRRLKNGGKTLGKLTTGLILTMTRCTSCARRSAWTPFVTE